MAANVDEECDTILAQLAEYLTSEMQTICIHLGISTTEYEKAVENNPRDIVTANRKILDAFWSAYASQGYAKRFDQLGYALRQAGRNDLRAEIERRKTELSPYFPAEHMDQGSGDQNRIHHQTAQPPQQFPHVQQPQFRQQVPPQAFIPTSPPPSYYHQQQVPTATESRPIQPTYYILTDKNLLKIANRVGTEYTRIATYLGLPFTQLQLLQQQHRNIRQLIIYMLTSWRDDKGPTTPDEELRVRDLLRTALSKSGRNDLAGIVASWQAPAIIGHNYMYAGESRQGPSNSAPQGTTGALSSMSSMSSNGTAPRSVSTNATAQRTTDFSATDYDTRDYSSRPGAMSVKGEGSSGATLDDPKLVMYRPLTAKERLNGPPTDLRSLQSAQPLQTGGFFTGPMSSFDSLQPQPYIPSMQSGQSYQSGRADSGVGSQSFGSAQPQPQDGPEVNLEQAGFQRDMQGVQQQMHDLKLRETSMDQADNGLRIVMPGTDRVSSDGLLTFRVRLLDGNTFVQVRATLDNVIAELKEQLRPFSAGCDFKLCLAQPALETILPMEESKKLGDCRLQNESVLFMIPVQ